MRSVHQLTWFTWYYWFKPTEWKLREYNRLWLKVGWLYTQHYKQHYRQTHHITKVTSWYIMIFHSDRVSSYGIWYRCFCYWRDSWWHRCVWHIRRSIVLRQENMHVLWCFVNSTIRTSQYVCFLCYLLSNFDPSGVLSHTLSFALPVCALTRWWPFSCLSTVVPQMWYIWTKMIVLESYKIVYSY